MLSLFSMFGVILDKTRLSLEGRSRFADILRHQKSAMGALGLSFLCLGFMILAIVWVWWSATHPPTAHFFLQEAPTYLVRADARADAEAATALEGAATTQRQNYEAGQRGVEVPPRNVELLSSRSPQMSFERVQSWLTRALMDAYTIDFVNFRDQLESSRILFREDTYKLFVDEMNSNLVPNVRKGRMILTMTPTSSVRLIEPATYEGRRLWMVEMKGLIYFDGSFSRKVPPRPVLFRVVVEEVPSSQTPYGIVISTISMTAVE